MAIEPWEVFMDKHIFWYLRIPGNENKTWHQIADERGQVEYEALSPAQKQPYIKRAATIKYRRLKRDDRNPPPGVRRVRRLRPILASYSDQVVRRRSEGDQDDYDGFAPRIFKPQAWSTRPLLIHRIDWSLFQRPDFKEARRTNKGHVWKAVRQLGHGGYGAAWLWVRVDNNVVQERLVAKDVSVFESWGTPQLWYPDRQYEIPMEAAMHRRSAIRSIHPGSNFVAKYSGFRLHPGLRMYRLATEYAEYNTLTHLICRFRPEGYNGTEYRNLPIPQAQQDNWTNTPTLSLHFVLDLFIALVKVVKHLNIRGIVHRDLGKPDNILLGAERDSASRFRRWGLKPLVTDFGLSMPIVSAFKNPQDMYEFPGATSTLAPEQIPTFPPLYPEPQDGKTNIYQLDILMAVVISGATWFDNFERAPQWEDRYMWKRVPPADNADRDSLNRCFRINSLRHHFRGIQPLVVECMRFRKQDRADLDDLLAELRRQRAEQFGDEDTDDSEDDSSDDGSSGWRGKHGRNRSGHQGGDGDEDGDSNNDSEDMSFRRYVARPGHNIFRRGARVNDQGRLVNEDGHLVDDFSRLINANRHLVDENGRLIDGRGRLVNGNEHLINGHGRLIDGVGRLVNANERLIDGNGRLIDEFNNWVNEAGQREDEEGNVVGGVVGLDAAQLEAESPAVSPITARDSLLHTPSPVPRLGDDQGPESPEMMSPPPSIGRTTPLVTPPLRSPTSYAETSPPGAPPRQGTRAPSSSLERSPRSGSRSGSSSRSRSMSPKWERRRWTRERSPRPDSYAPTS